MPRELVLGNGRLYLAYDARYQLRDLYYPHVGLENHAGGHPSRLGVWVAGRFAWTGDKGWSRDLRYRDGVLVGDSTLTHAGLGVRLRVEEAVHPEVDLLARRFTVTNLRERAREVRLFVHHDLRLYGNDIGDTALLDPRVGAIVHYKNERYFLSHLAPEGGEPVAYSTGVKAFRDLEGTWRDAEDGVLAMNPMTHGSVDFVQGARLAIPGGGSAVCDAWLAAGRTWDEVRERHAHALARGVPALLLETQRHWRDRVPGDAGDALRDAGLARLYRMSAVIAASQVADTGAVLAANDTDIQSFNRDHYSYVWPRDGAFVAHALSRAGMHDLAARYYRYLLPLVTPEGYLLHKYNVNGTLASSWHTWLLDGEPVLPIQEDETALTAWGVHDLVGRTGDLALAREAWPAVKRMADWMVSFRDSATGLPLPSWDPWEERRGVLTYTACTVVAGLRSAAALAAILGKRAGPWERVAAEVLSAVEEHLYDEGERRFCRLRPLPTGGALGEPDMTPDASLAALFWFDLFPVTDPRVRRTLDAVAERLWIPGPVGGLARYERDYYHQKLPHKKATGNPWVVTTLWLADYYAALGKPRRARELLRWVAERARPSGVLAEQFHPATGEPLSVAPLTWSHAAFVTSCQRYLASLTPSQGRR